ncbi:MAG: hypothetical protein ACI4EA_03700 [Candidatus Ornithomonoglobus sp.]
MIENVERLPDLHFIAGSRQNLDFEFYNDDGDAFNVSSATIVFTVGDESRKNMFLKKELTAAEGSSGVYNLVTAEITSSETESWSGKYIAQLQIVFSEENTIIPAEMLLLVEKKIGGVIDSAVQSISESGGFC